MNSTANGGISSAANVCSCGTYNLEPIKLIKEIIQLGWGLLKKKMADLDF